MVALKLILQSLAGVVAVSGAVGGTFALSNKTATTQTEEQTQQTQTEPEKELIKKEEQAEKPKAKPESSTIRLPQGNARTLSGRRVKQEIAITEVAINANNQAKKDFYLVSADFEIGHKKPTIDLFSDTNPTEKNYQCVKSSQAGLEVEETMGKDASCILYSLKVSSNKALKTSEIQAFIKNTTQTPTIASKVTQQSQIRQNKFFLLQANDNLIQFAANKRHQTAYLTTKDVTSLTYEKNNFAMLVVHAKISANDVDGKTDSIIAKAISEKQTSTNHSDDSFPNYQCSFNSEEWKTNCTLSKLPSYTPTTSFNFSSQTINTTLKTTTTETNSYYFIQSIAIKSHTAKTLKGSTATYFEAQTNASPFSTPLSIEAPVFAKFNSGGTRISELIILDK